MYNAATKSIIVFALAATMAACSGKSDGNDAATELYSQAEAQLQAGNTQNVYLLLDSLKSEFPDSVALQRKGMLLRRKAQLIDIEANITSTDDSVTLCKDKVTELQPRLKTINDPRLVEPFTVAKDGYNPDFLSTTGIQARVDDIGQFYLISSLQSPLKHTGISISAGGESASAGPVPYDGELNYRINGSEVITFSPLQSQAIGEFASTHRDTPASLSFTGGKSHSAKLTAKQVNAIADCYDYSQAMTRGRSLSIRHEKLNREKDLALKQISQLQDAIK